MAINKIENSAYLDADWQNEIISKNLLKKGFENLDFVDDNTIASGSAVEANGVIYQFDTNTTIPGTAAENSYLTFTGGITPSIQYVTDSLPDYDYSRKGYYDSSGNRFLYVFKKNLLENLSTSSKIWRGLYFDKSFDQTLNWQFSTYDFIEAIDSNSDSSSVYISTADYLVKKIIKSSGTEDWTYTDPSNSASYTLSLSPDGDSLYTFPSTYIRQLGRSSGTANWSMTSSDYYIRSSTLNSDGSKLYIGTTAGKVIKVDVATQTEDWNISPHTSDVKALVLNSDGTKLYSGAEDGEVKRIDTSSQTVDWTFSYSSILKSLKIKSDDSKLYISRAGNFGGGDISQINIVDKTEDWKISYEYGVEGISINPIDTKLYISSKGIIQIDIVTGTEDWIYSPGPDTKNLTVDYTKNNNLPDIYYIATDLNSITPGLIDSGFIDKLP